MFFVSSPLEANFSYCLACYGGLCVPLKDMLDLLPMDCFLDTSDSGFGEAGGSLSGAAPEAFDAVPGLGGLALLGLPGLRLPDRDRGPDRLCLELSPAFFSDSFRLTAFLVTISGRLSFNSMLLMKL